ncbi:MAG TPA: hypothetical protein VGJ15_11745, partial [Pirellulales bacterium]
MSETLTSEIKASIGWLFQDQLDTGMVSDSSQLTFHQPLATGTGSSQADRIWHVARTLAAGAHDDLVLSGLEWDLFDNSLAIELATVKAVLLINTATSDGENLAVGAAATHPWPGPFAATGNQLIVSADACLLLVNQQLGWPV